MAVAQNLPELHSVSEKPQSGLPQNGFTIMQSLSARQALAVPRFVVLLRRQSLSFSLEQPFGHEPSPALHSGAFSGSESMAVSITATAAITINAKTVMRFIFFFPAGSPHNTKSFCGNALHKHLRRRT